MAALKDQPQIGLLDELLENDALAELLEKRQKAKDARAPLHKEYVTRHKQATAEIEELHLAEGTYRCGRFVIRIGQTESKHVEFERNSSTRISIRPAKGDD